jgi:glycosyltransferase involved in cell wall biosynthesis
MMDAEKSQNTDTGEQTVVVAIPCYNEALTIAKVIGDFQRVLPGSPIHVFDNNSTDDSREIAKTTGAILHSVQKQGKGNVMRAIFDSISADMLVVVDGDDTYFAEDVHKLIAPVMNGEAEMAVGDRIPAAGDESMKPHRRLGNIMIVAAINRLFGTQFRDILSGYRVFSRRFVDTIPLLTPGFETETELTLLALEEDLDIIEIPISYRSRPAGSESKLHALKDGYRIMLTAVVLLRDHHPVRFFGAAGIICILFGIVAGILRVLNFIALTDFSNSLLSGLVLLLLPLGTLSIGVGLILNAINTRFKQVKQIMQREKRQDG